MYLSIQMKFILIAIPVILICIHYTRKYFRKSRRELNLENDIYKLIVEYKIKMDDVEEIRKFDFAASTIIEIIMNREEEFSHEKLRKQNKTIRNAIVVIHMIGYPICFYVIDIISSSFVVQNPSNFFQAQTIVFFIISAIALYLYSGKWKDFLSHPTTNFYGAGLSDQNDDTLPITLTELKKYIAYKKR